MNTGLEGEIVLAVGPEGDFTCQEKDMMIERGFINASLAETVLRVETAAVSTLAQLKALAAC